MTPGEAERFLRAIREDIECDLPRFIGNVEAMHGSEFLHPLYPFTPVHDGPTIDTTARVVCDVPLPAPKEAK